MTTEDFNLSEKIQKEVLGYATFNEVVSTKDVREFVRRLLASPDFDEEDRDFIKKLAGDDLK